MKKPISLALLTAGLCLLSTVGIVHLSLELRHQAEGFKISMLQLKTIIGAAASEENSASAHSSNAVIKPTTVPNMDRAEYALPRNFSVIAKKRTAKVAPKFTTALTTKKRL